jgi:hypothetical protein
MARWHMAWVGMASGFLLLTTAAPAQTGPDPRENSFQFFVDGQLTAGVIGFRIEFNHDPQNNSTARKLNTQYSPDNRRFVVTVTQKGLNRLQDWINSATGTGPVLTKQVYIIVKDNNGNVLVRWDLTDVTPATLSSTGTGILTEVDATIEFAYATLTQSQANPN